MLKIVLEIFYLLLYFTFLFSLFVFVSAASQYFSIKNTLTILSTQLRLLLLIKLALHLVTSCLFRAIEVKHRSKVIQGKLQRTKKGKCHKHSVNLFHWILVALLLIGMKLTILRKTLTILIMKWIKVVMSYCTCQQLKQNWFCKTLQI
jgi:hypothetical protein